MRILITGSNGLLGQKIVALCLSNRVDFLATSLGENRNQDCPSTNYQQLDITNETEVNHIFNSFKPSHVIHTAAITNVDYCELNEQECHLVNTKAVEFLFNASKLIKAHFQLLSTDFVFDGEKGNYNEEDEVNPLSIYAVSKVNAENVLLHDDYKDWSIVRTIIVYGTGNNLSRSNIICWAKEALKKGDNLTIIDDQFRAPTWADDLAWACIEICKMSKNGIFHISGPETMSIYEIVNRIANHFSYSTEKLNRSNSKDLNQPAKRPSKTGFDLSKAQRELNYNPLTLEKTLDLLKNK
jgi:dTDP-4-dehydrorhamnose reductase